MREKEIEQIFKENPQLSGQSLKSIALFFYIQGELSSSHVREMERQRANFYRYRLHISDPDLARQCDEAIRKLFEESFDSPQSSHLQRIK